MDTRKKTDLISGACVIAFGIFVVVESSRLPYVSEYGPGPGFFPLWIGIGIVSCSLLMLCSAVYRGGTGTEEQSKISASQIARALGAWSVFILAIVLLPLIGFALSLGLLTAFLVIVLDRRSPWLAVATGLGLAVSFYLVFNVALGVSLPVGALGF